MPLFKDLWYHEKPVWISKTKFLFTTIHLNIETSINNQLSPFSVNLNDNFPLKVNNFKEIH